MTQQVWNHAGDLETRSVGPGFVVTCTSGSEAWLVYDEGRRFDLVGPSLRDRALILKVVHNLHV